jgi:aerobic-type carbon monoxide dehydrogenase small subunit (CoxS/CutS family)
VPELRVIVDDPDGTSYTSPTCGSGGSFDASIRTVKAARTSSRFCEALTTHFAFQCGYCTAGFRTGRFARRLAKADAGRS